MPSLCDKIKSNLSCLPSKDAKLCEVFFAKRDFQSILDIAKSALTMKELDDAKEVHKEKWEKVDIDTLQELVLDTQEYLSYIDVSDFSLEEDYYD